METRLHPTLPRPLGTATGMVFGALSGLRGKRVFHPRGVRFTATVDCPGSAEPTGSTFLDQPGGYAAVVRLSKATGLPDGVPDILGIALRVLDVDGPGRHRDLLFASSASPVALRHLLVPARRFGSRTCSAILPYRTRDGRRLMLAAATRNGPSFAQLEHAAVGLPRIDLLWATPTGRWSQFGAVVPGMRLPAQEDVAFDPWNADPDLWPSGLLNALRHPAYAASRKARPPREEQWPAQTVRRIEEVARRDVH